MPELVRVDTAGVQAMAARWDASVGELIATTAPSGLGFSYQASAVAVDVAHVDIATFTAALSTRVETRATHVSEADSRYVANEADSAGEMTAVADRVTGVR
jgi:hypothetical protein